MIVITTMDTLPDYCYDCPCHNGETGLCRVDVDGRSTYEYRPYWCPLKNIPNEFKNKEPELTDEQLEDVVYENQKAYDNGYVKGFHDAKVLERNILLNAEIERSKRPDCEHANHDGAGCLGYCGCKQDDEPIDACKQCEKYTGNICAEY